MHTSSTPRVGRSVVAQVARFIFAGIINTLVGYGIYFILVTFAIPYLLAFTISTILGVLFNYLTYSRFVFKRRGRKEAFLFAILYIVNYLVGLELLHMLVWAKLDPRLAGAFNMVIISALSYILQKKIVFKER